MTLMREFWHDGYEWLRGHIVRDKCPFCKRMAFSSRHQCSAVKGMTNPQAVRRVAEEVRAILGDEPADRFVHTAYEAIDNLEKAFPEEPR